MDLHADAVYSMFSLSTVDRLRPVKQRALFAESTSREVGSKFGLKPDDREDCSSDMLV